MKLPKETTGDQTVKIIPTHLDDPAQYTDFERDNLYNGLDVCVTQDVFNATHPQLDPITAATYTFSRALQGPVLDMRCRGVLVDLVRRGEVIDELCDSIDHIEQQLNRIIYNGVGMSGDFNWRSNADLQRLFYTELGISPITKQGRPTTDRNAREKLAAYPIATQLIHHINALTELGDKLSVLRTAIDPDGRIRTSYNIAGTSTGRFSSSLSEFGTGGNLQNVEESLRSIFIADPGYKFAKFDAKSGESFCVGAIEWNLFRDGTYLDACETGDPHTAVARIVWPELDWTGDLSRDKETAERPYYRHHSYRFMCKKLGHGSNYGGKPYTLAQQTQLPIDVVAGFQPKYFNAFPAHRRWQAHVEHTLRSMGHLTSLTGRKRWFLGRRSDPSTLREAIAYDPQCSLADIVNSAMLKIWRMGIATVMMQDHDAITFMYKESDEERIIPILLRELEVPIPLADGRVLRIPYDAEVGWNKGHVSSSNPDGLIPYRGHDPRRRHPIRNLLDNLVASHKVS
jgi:DNA polymerase-1